MAMDKKRHHYVPVTYLDAFTAPDHMLFAYRKDDPSKVIRSKPEEIGFEKYYYSQPLPDEKQDNNRLEDFFGTIESPWPGIVSALKAGYTDKPLVAALFEFMALMRVRVPAAREMVEANLAEQVKATAQLLERTGDLPPKPEGLEDLWDHVNVSIDPHMSIHAMPYLAKGFGMVLDSIGYGVIHNKTNLSFITSDNPVAYFDPSVSESAVQPYRVLPKQRPIELFFPLDPKTVLIGHSRWRETFLDSGIQSYELSDVQEVKRINRFIARFGYRFLFSSDQTHQRLVEKYSEKSPVGETLIFPEDRGNSIVLRTIFGQRPKLPKWVRKPGQRFEDPRQEPDNAEESS